VDIQVFQDIHELQDIRVFQDIQELQDIRDIQDIQDIVDKVDIRVILVNQDILVLEFQVILELVSQVTLDETVQHHHLVIQD
jgi:hypothetical protein